MRYIYVIIARALLAMQRSRLIAKCRLLFGAIGDSYVIMEGRTATYGSRDIMAAYRCKGEWVLRVQTSEFFEPSSSYEGAFPHVDKLFSLLKRTFGEHHEAVYTIGCRDPVRIRLFARDVSTGFSCSISAYDAIADPTLRRFVADFAAVINEAMGTEDGDKSG